ncbi:MAG: DUF1598 domain-containing protein [Thermoguttaceae bacterium]|jgi:hypothetical protein
MYYRVPGVRAVLVMAILAVLAAGPSKVLAQAGVAVDAEGVLRLKMSADPGGRLAKEHAVAARATLASKAATPSKLRKISLKHLEQVILEKQGVLGDEVRNLAGLLRVRYVFYYPDSQDIVLAGPAEGWRTDAFGRVVGIESGRPVVLLEDLAVALRTFAPAGPASRLVGCSIDPTQEGLAAMQRFLASIHPTPGDVQMIVNGLRTSLGLQTISVFGVSPKTHFAQVMVEADYRMKLIGIGLEKPPVRLVSYVDRATPSQVSRNALARWFFTPDYQCVRTTGDGLAMELVGDGVKVVGADEVVGAGGQRQSSGQADAASHAFVASFTKVYSELADKSPVFAQLRNQIDLLVAAAYLHDQNLYAKAGWKMEVLGDEKVVPVETQNAPKQVSTAVNALWKGHHLMTPVGGGVQIAAQTALSSENLLRDEDGKVAKVRRQTRIELAKGQWWWD